MTSYSECEKLIEKIKELEQELKGCRQIQKIFGDLTDQLYAILDSIDAIVYVADMDSYEVLFVNKYARNIFGDIVGEKCWQTLQTDQSGPCPFCTNDRLLDEDGKPVGTLEWEFQNTVDGSWYAIKDRAITWVDGRLVRLEIATDISERKKYEAQLKENEEKFRAFVDYTYDWEYWITPAGELLYISPSCERITGYQAPDFLDDAELLYSIVHPEDQVLFTNHTKQELQKETTAYLEFRIVAKTGETKWIAHNCQPIYDKAENHLGRHVSNRDITQRVQAEEALQENEKRFRLALDATSDGLWDRNLLTGQVYYGENWAKFLGYSPKEIEEEGITWETLLHPDDKHSTLAAVQNHINGNTSRYVAEFRLLNKTGLYQWVLAKGKVVEWDEEGRPLRFVGTHSDISKRKKAERELLRTNQKIKEFAYSVVHDLKNPSLVTDSLATKLLHNYHDLLDNKGRLFCKHIKRSAEQIENLVGKINTLIATNEIPVMLEEVSLEECLQIIQDEYSSQLESRNINFLFPDNLPTIQADQLSILRVLRNLIDNALKYGGENLTTIEIGHKETATHHILSVHDDGVGLKQVGTKGIFKKFMRKNNALGIEGTGLGLAAVKEIVTQHKGELWVEHPEKGITFFFSIAKQI